MLVLGGNVIFAGIQAVNSMLITSRFKSLTSVVCYAFYMCFITKTSLNNLGAPREHSLVPIATVIEQTHG